jgi:hypothetical protein
MSCAAVGAHDVNLEVQHILSDIDVAASILSYGPDSAADHLVMGAYGHSRFHPRRRHPQNVIIRDGVGADIAMSENAVTVITE